MSRLRVLVVMGVLGTAVGSLMFIEASPMAAQGATWVKLEGSVVWPKATAIPAAKPLNVATDKEHCGALNSEEIVINPKNRGLKNVWVYLRPDSKDKSAKLDPKKDIKPELVKGTGKTHDVDQPKCAFIPRVMAIREGDFINYKNSSPVSHNTKLDADPPSPSFNKTIAPGGSYKDHQPFVAQRSPVVFSCSIHPWMSGRFMVFDHPYFAVTNDDGKFTIPDCPEGNYRIVYRHEGGFHKGREGALGWPITIKAGANGAMEVKPLEFELPPESK